jgi:hypothetical protein
METTGINYEAQCQELQARLKHEKDRSDAHIAELVDRLQGYEKENEILRAKLSVVEMIFGK